MGAGLSTGAKHIGVMPERSLTSEANNPEFYASSVMLHRKNDVICNAQPGALCIHNKPGSPLTHIQ